MPESHDRRARDKDILDRLEYMDSRREEMHEENKRLLIEHETRDVKLFDDHEVRLRHMEKYVWGAIGAMVLLHGLADAPKLVASLLGR